MSDLKGNGSRSPGRPRDTKREQDILHTVLQLLAEKGYAAVTFEEVARRSRASKATLYRRWSTKREMVVAAVRQGPASASEARVDLGSLRADLLGLCHRLVQSLATSDGALILTLLQAGLEDPDLCELLERAAGPTGARLPADVLERAVRREELPVGASPFAYEEVVGSALVLRTLNGLPTDQTYLEQLIDSVIIPALAAPPPQVGRHQGIFSGHPLPDGTK